MRRYSVLFGLLAAAQAACMHTVAVRERPSEYIAAHSPPTATLTLAASDPVVVTLPRVVADTIFGWSRGKEVSIPVQDVKEVRVRKLSVVRNALIGGAVLGAGAVALVSTANKHSTAAPICASTLTGGIEPDERQIDPTC